MDGVRSRACALIRVSTEEQARGGFGLKFQEEDIRKFCARNDLDLVSVFRDEGYSGSTAERPGFKQMMEWANERRFDVLVVWKLDRLFRDTKLTLQTIDTLSGLNIEFRSVQESFTHDSNGRFLLTIFAAGAEKERKDINLRMYSGRTAAAKRGILVNGASTPPYGYRYDTIKKKLVVAKEEAAIVRQIFQWFVEERTTLYRIQCRLNDMKVPTKYDRLGRTKPTKSKAWWHKRTVGRIIENETYTGRLILRKYRRGQLKNQSNQRPEHEWITIEVPQIIPQRMFERAQKQLLINAEHSHRNTQKLYLLGKLLICGNDGRRMSAITMPSGKGGADVKYYYCNSLIKGNAASSCNSYRIREDRIAPLIWEKLKELLSNPAVVLQRLALYQGEKTMVLQAKSRTCELEREKDKATRQLQRLSEVYVCGAIDKAFYSKEYGRIRDQMDQIHRELKQVGAVASSADRIKDHQSEITELYGLYRDRLKRATDEVRYEIMHIFIEYVVVHGEELQIAVRLPPIKPAGEAQLSAIEGQLPSLASLNREQELVLLLHARLLPKK
jgi:site-specific DNA recombinase